MNFGKAIEALKEGKKVARKGWNGKGMWLSIFKPVCFVALTKEGTVQTKEYFIDSDKELTLSPAIYMKTTDDKFVPWIASQTDTLADDWIIVE